MSIAPSALSPSAGVRRLCRMTDGAHNVGGGDLKHSRIFFDLAGFRWGLLARQRHHYLWKGIVCSEHRLH